MNSLVSRILMGPCRWGSAMYTCIINPINIPHVTPLVARFRCLSASSDRTKNNKNRHHMTHPCLSPSLVTASLRAQGVLVLCTQLGGHVL